MVKQVSDTQGEPLLKIIINNTQSFYLKGLPTIESLIDHIRTDMIIHDDIYEKMDMRYVFQNDHITPLVNFDIDGVIASNIKTEEIQEGGMLSEIKKITYKNGEVYYFKPIVDVNENIGLAGQISGIPYHNSNMHNRSIFTYKMSEHFQFHIVPVTGLTEDESGIPGYVQKEAPGKSAESVMADLKKHKQLHTLKSNPILARKIIELQLLDALTGQADRNFKNYFISLPSGEVIAIDNDICAGENVDHSNMLIPSFRNDGYLHNKLSEFEMNVTDYIGLIFNSSCDSEEIEQCLLQNNSPLAGRAVFLPPVMDTNMVKQFTELSYVELVNIMSQLNFSNKEIKAACNRLKSIKFHISVLQQRQANGVLSIIDPSEWGSEETQKRMFPEKVVGNALLAYASYLGRDIDLTEGKIDYLPPDWTTNQDKPDQPKNAADIIAMPEHTFLNTFYSF